jgi:hypothetical protein
MLFKKAISSLILFFSGCILIANAQQVTCYNLVDLLHQNNLDTGLNQQTHVTDSTQKQAISTKGVVWLKGVTFKDGTIDVDLRGKDVLLQSFLGIAFHAKNNKTYDLVYFRPFRFHSTDIPTRKWSVQYMSLPDYDYTVLRKDHPGVYENNITPAPQATDWFHATIVIKGDWITVFVNHSTTASLKVKKLTDVSIGMIGLWSSTGALSSDFADLTVTQ